MRDYASKHGKKKFFQFGEAFDGNDTLIGAYTKAPDQETLICEDEVDNANSWIKGGRIDSVFYFSHKFWVFDGVFKWSGATRNIETLFNMRKDNYGAEPYKNGPGVPPQKVLVNFIENHDISRFLYEQPSTSALHTAFAYLLTMDGIPCIYYGSEQEFDGGNDPSNREDMIFDVTNPTFKVVQKLISLRKQNEALMVGDFVIRWVTDNTGDEEDAGVLAFERLCGPGETKGGHIVSEWASCAAGSKDVLVVINVHNDKESKTGGDMVVSFAPGTVLKDIYSGAADDTWTVSGDGTVSIPVPARGIRILTPAQ